MFLLSHRSGDFLVDLYLRMAVPSPFVPIDRLYPQHSHASDHRAGEESATVWNLLTVSFFAVNVVEPYFVLIAGASRPT